MRVYLLGLLVVALASSAHAQALLNPTWMVVEGGYTTDAIAVGDVHSNTGDELVVLSEGSTWYNSPPTIGTGKAMVYDLNGNKLNQFFPPTDRDTLGFPIIEQLDNGPKEYLIGEFQSVDDSGAVYALSGTSTDPSDSKWILTPRGWPGHWNMGVSAANAFAGGGRELVIPSYDGIIQVVARADGAVLATYDTWLNHGEVIYGHVALASVMGPGKQVVVAGGWTGRVMVLRIHPDGTMTPDYVSGVNPDGGWVAGSGPAIGDIDGDGDPEIVVAFTGPNPVIRAFDPLNSVGGGCEYQWTLTGGSDYFWTSPVIGDVDGDGINEVVVESNDSRLSVLTAEGVVSDPILCNEGAYEVTGHVIGTGGASWFTPVLADLTGDSAVDIVAASYTHLEVLDIDAAGSVATAYRAVDLTATFYPSAAVVPTAAGAAIFVSGWVNGAIYRYDINENVPSVPWATFMGGNTRSGFCCPDADCSTCSSGLCAEACTQGCDLVCDTPGCDCDFDCAGSDDCAASCENGTTCVIDCSDTDRCEGDCRDGSVCEWDCTNATKCDKIDCREGATCGIACTGTDLCKVDCDSGSTCNADCSNSKKCEVNDCKAGSICTVNCSNSEECQVDKCDESTCNIDCTNGGDCKNLKCDHNSTCTIGCAGADKCEAECKNGSTCDYDCTGANECKKIKCESGSQCLLDCTGAGDCEYDACDGGQISCTGDVIACNRSCP